MELINKIDTGELTWGLIVMCAIVAVYIVYKNIKQRRKGP